MVANTFRFECLNLPYQRLGLNKEFIGEEALIDKGTRLERFHLELLIGLLRNCVTLSGFFIRVY